MADAHNPLNRRIGELESRKYRDDFFSEQAEGSVTGPTTETLYITPTFGPGEVWDLRILVSLSSENTSGEVVVTLWNEAEDSVIVRRIIDTYEKNHFELRAIVTKEDVGFGGANSPDITMNVIGTDSFNYFVTCRGIRLRGESNTTVLNDETTGTNTAEMPDRTF